MRLEQEEIDQLAAAVAQRVLAALRQGGSLAAPASTADVPAMLSEPEAAARYGVATHVLRYARQRGELHFLRVGKCVRYEPAQLEEWNRRNTDREVRKNGRNSKTI